MAYIDKDKVLKAVEKMDRLDKETKTKFEYDKEGFLLLINSAPTADVVEVVSCKDCVNSRPLCDTEKRLYCENCVGCTYLSTSYHSVIMFANDFCSYGKRKEVN